MRDRYRSLPGTRFDVVVIGAGAGGLTAAALLARRGRRVLVVDPQYVVGGNTITFRRRDYRFDVGVHYVGGCQPGGRIPRILAAAGADQVGFEEMDPDGYDTLVFPDRTFRFPKGLDRYAARLHEAFPKEAKGIRRYTRFLRELGDYVSLAERPWRLPLVLARTRLLPRWAPRTLAAFLDTCTQDPALRAIIAGQNGDYGLPPSRASAAVAMGLTRHYLDGAFYPKGGGQAIADALAGSVEANGGAVLLRTRATRIQVRDGRVTGVVLESKHLGRFEVPVDTVVSNADLKRTLLELVGPEQLPPSLVTRVKGFEMAHALGMLFLVLDRDLVAEGHPRTNYWIYPDYDLEAPYRAVARGDFPPPAVYVSIASVKDPTNRSLAPPGHTNLEVMSLAPAQPEAWGVTEAQVRSGEYERDPAYLERKAEYGERLLAAARPALGDLAPSVVYQEVATPLTHRRYTGATGGTSYGIALTPEQTLGNRPGTRTPIQGLFLAGASTRSGHGIGGVLHSGLVAADRILGDGLAREVLTGRSRRRRRRVAPTPVAAADRQPPTASAESTASPPAPQEEAPARPAEPPAARRA